MTAGAVAATVAKIDAIAQNDLHEIFDTPPEPTANVPPKDRVDVSVFASPQLTAGQQELIQVFLHLQEDIIKAARIAAKSNPEANRVASSTLNVAIERGSTVELLLESKNLIIEQAFQEVVWNGSPTHVGFGTRVSPSNTDNAINATLIVGVGGIAIGKIDFSLPVINSRILDVDRDENSTKPIGVRFAPMEVSLPIDVSASKVLVNGCAHKYKTAFISYSRKDFKEASLFAQGLSEHNIGLFFDVTSIEPGTEWEQDIIDNIPKADTFYLMWSENAARSEWVIRESRIAVNS